MADQQHARHPDGHSAHVMQAVDGRNDGNERQDSHLSRTAASATLHCLTGCAIGEVLGFILGSAYGLSGRATVALAVGLAFLFGYLLSMLPLLRTGLALRSAIGLVLAADTLSIVTMEVVDNAAMALIPGAMSADLPDPLFWFSMTLALAAAFLAAWPVNRYLLKRGKGHALVHAIHHGAASTPTPAGLRRWIPDVSTAALASCIVAFQLGGFASALGSSLGDDAQRQEPSRHAGAVVGQPRSS